MISDDINKKSDTVCDKDNKHTKTPPVNPREMKDMSRPLSFFGAISAIYTGTTVYTVLG